MKKLHFVDDFYKKKCISNKGGFNLRHKYVSSEKLYNICWSYSDPYGLSYDEFVKLSKRLGFYTRKIDGVVNIRIFVYDKRLASMEMDALDKLIVISSRVLQDKTLHCSGFECSIFLQPALDRLDYVKLQIQNNKL